MFYKWHGGHILLALVYVDLIITGSNSYIVLQVIFYMQHTFAPKDLGELNYFLSIQFTKTEKAIHLSQAKYIADLLVKHHMDKRSPCQTPMATCHHLIKNSSAAINNASQYKSIIGALEYVTLTRLEIAFSVDKLSQFLSNPSDDSGSL